MPKILFIRGLNTYADEQQHFGPLKFGEIASPLASYFRLAGLKMAAVPNIGTGTLDEHVENAAKSLTSLPCWKSNESFHLLGHSIGGLVARALVQRPEIRERVLSVGSIGTPHQGAEIAEIVKQLEQTKPLIQKMMSLFDYDTRARSNSFATLTRESVAEFNKETPDHPDVGYFSLVCAAPRDLQALPYRLLQFQMPDFLRFEENDGMIPAASQKHGRILGYYKLDHMMEVGYCLDVRPRIRRHFQNEFTRMVGDLVYYYQGFGRIPEVC